MRFGSVVLIALVGTAVSTPARAYVMPYDPYPWCAVYGGRDGGGTNCDFLTIGQCRATVSGMAASARPINSTIRGRPHAPAKNRRTSLH